VVVVTLFWHSFVAGPKKFARRSEFYIFTAPGTAVCCAFVRTARWILSLAVKWPKPRSTRQDAVGGRKRLHESEHARVSLNTETFCSIFSAARAIGSSINRRIWDIRFRRNFLFTFHSLRTRRIYRGVLRPKKSFGISFFAVSFFPRLVAGPIVRAGDFLAAASFIRHV